MKILLINPPYNGKSIERRHRCTRIDPNDWVHPPLPLMCLYSVLEEKGAKVELVDAIHKKLNHQDILKICQKIKPEVVVSWTGNFSHPIDIQILQVIKQEFPKIFTVLTGTDIISAKPEIFLAKDFIDLVVIGEAELSMDDLVDFWQGKKKKSEIRNAAYREDNGNYTFGPKEQLQDLDSIPFPNRQVVSNEYYIGFPFLSEKFTDILTSRGCPFHCTFCTSSLYWGQGYRVRSAKNIVDEIQQCIEKFGIETFFIADDEFAINQQRTLEMCDEIRKRQLKIKWACQMRVTTPTEELIKQMTEAGCVYIHFGVEFGTQKELDFFKKDITPEQTIKAFELTKKYRIENCATVIIGTPEGTKEDIKATVDLVKKIKPDYIHISPLIPIVGSPYYHQLKEEGRLKNEKYNQYVKPNIMFIPKNMTEDEIRKEISRNWLKLSFRPYYIWGHLKRAIKKRDFHFFKEATKASFWIIKNFIRYKPLG